MNDMKITKEQTMKENAILKHNLEKFATDDEARRKTLSELLDSYEWTYDSFGGYSNNRNKKQVVVQSWLGIAFLIGELKADADYAMCIQARDNLRQENQSLQKEINELKHPSPPTSITPI